MKHNKNNISLYFVMLLIVISSCNYNKISSQKEYSSELYKLIVFSKKDYMREYTDQLSDNLSEEDFYRLIIDLINNPEFDEEAFYIGLVYASENGYCDYIPVINERISLYDQRVGKEWFVKVSPSYRKQYFFKNENDRQRYKKYVIKPNLDKLVNRCSDGNVIQ